MSEFTRELARVKTSLADVEARINALKAYDSEAGLAELTAQAAGLRSMKESIEKALRDHSLMLEALPETERRYVDIFRTRLQKEAALTALEGRLLQTKIAEAAQLSTMRVIDPAVAPVYPEYPQILVNTAAAAFAGLLLALGLTLFKEYTHPCVRTPQELAELGATCAGKVPFQPPMPSEASRERIPQGRIQRLFQSLVPDRSRVTRRHLEHLLLNLTDSDEATTFCFVSPHVGDGRTYVVGKLLALLKKHAKKVLLIDTATSKLHEAAGLPISSGLEAVFSGKKSLRDQVRTIDEGLDFVDAGTPNESVVVSTKAADVLRSEIDGLKSDYDIVILKSPAAREAPDARRIWRIMDKIVCIVDTTNTRQKDLRDLLDELKAMKKDTAVVLNKLKYPGDYDFRS
ncbi:hypothetical protein ACFL01_03505, partial [Planctomycetota bacterium]